ncbi:MAG: hypothetical protein QM710_00165 [Flavobacterium sp.]
MKKLLTTLAFLAISLGASAQQDNTDQLQQQPPRETQAEMEKAAARDAKKAEEEKAKEEKAKEAEHQAKLDAQKEAERKDTEAQADQKKKTKGK